MNNNIQISFKKVEKDKKGKLLEILEVILMSWLLYFSISLSLTTIFKMNHILLLITIPGLLLIVAMSFLSFKREVFLKFLFIFMLFLVGFILFNNKYIGNGFLLSINKITEIIGKSRGKYINQYSISISKELYKKSIILFWTILSLLIAFLSWINIKRNKKNLLWILILPMFIFGLYIKVSLGFFTNLLLVFSSILLINNSFVNTSNVDNMIGERKSEIVFYSGFTMALILLVVILLMWWLKPSSNYSKNNLALEIRNSIENSIEKFRYEKEKTNTFTQGDFKNLGKLELLEEPALEVIMDNPTSLYLKGYSGSKYTSNGWENLDNEIYYNSYGLFYWLNESKFNNFNQLNIVNDLKKDSKEEEKTDIIINNINANSKYLYIPYEIDEELNEFENIKLFDDSNIKFQSFFGERLYTYKSNTNLVKKYPELANNIYKLSDKRDPKVNEYLKYEDNYSNFVYKNYTEIPKDIEFLIKNYLEEDPDTMEERISYEKAISLVKDYLKTNIKYNLDVEPKPKDKDFAHYFLQESKEGYSTHYATMATLMFRYLEIPSRYVEGYLVTPQDVEGVNSLETITIEGTNAHAWPEIYLDGVGWIPIEVTPDYYDVMEKIDKSNYPLGDGFESNKEQGTSGTLSQGEQEIIDDQEEIKSEPVAESKDNLNIIQKILIGLLIILVLVVLIYLYYFIKNKIRLKSMKNSFKDPNYKKAVPRMFAYIIFLLNYNGIAMEGGSIYNYTEKLSEDYSEEYSKKFDKVAEINQKAIFSQYKIEKEDHDKIEDFMNNILCQILESKNIFQKMKMKFWDFIY